MNSKWYNKKYIKNKLACFSSMWYYVEKLYSFSKYICKLALYSLYRKKQEVKCVCIILIKSGLAKIKSKFYINNVSYMKTWIKALNGYFNTYENTRSNTLLNVSNPAIDSTKFFKRFYIVDIFSAIIWLCVCVAATVLISDVLLKLIISLYVNTNMQALNWLKFDIIFYPIYIVHYIYNRIIILGYTILNQYLIPVNLQTFLTIIYENHLTVELFRKLNKKKRRQFINDIERDATVEWLYEFEQNYIKVLQRKWMMRYFNFKRWAKQQAPHQWRTNVLRKQFITMWTPKVKSIVSYMKNYNVNSIIFPYVKLTEFLNLLQTSTRKYFNSRHDLVISKLQKNINIQWNEESQKMVDSYIYNSEARLLANFKKLQKKFENLHEKPFITQQEWINLIPIHEKNIFMYRSNMRLKALHSRLWYQTYSSNVPPYLIRNRVSIRALKAYLKQKYKIHKQVNALEGLINEPAKTWWHSLIAIKPKSIWFEKLYTSNNKSIKKMLPSLLTFRVADDRKMDKKTLRIYQIWKNSREKNLQKHVNIYNHIMNTNSLYNLYDQDFFHGRFTTLYRPHKEFGIKLYKQKKKVKHVNNKFDINAIYNNIEHETVKNGFDINAIYNNIEHETGSNFYILKWSRLCILIEYLIYNLKEIILTVSYHCYKLISKYKNNIVNRAVMNQQVLELVKIKINNGKMITAWLDGLNGVWINFTFFFSIWTWIIINMVNWFNKIYYNLPFSKDIIWFIWKPQSITLFQMFSVYKELLLNKIICSNVLLEIVNHYCYYTFLSLCEFIKIDILNNIYFYWHNIYMNFTQVLSYFEIFAETNISINLHFLGVSEFMDELMADLMTKGHNEINDALIKHCELLTKDVPFEKVHKYQLGIMSKTLYSAMFPEWLKIATTKMLASAHLHSLDVNDAFQPSTILTEFYPEFINMKLSHLHLSATSSAQYVFSLFHNVFGKFWNGFHFNSVQTDFKMVLHFFFIQFIFSLFNIYYFKFLFEQRHLPNPVHVHYFSHI